MCMYIFIWLPYLCFVGMTTLPLFCRLVGPESYLGCHQLSSGNLDRVLYPTQTTTLERTTYHSYLNTWNPKCAFATSVLVSVVLSHYHYFCFLHLSVPHLQLYAAKSVFWYSMCECVASYCVKHESMTCIFINIITSVCCILVTR